MQKFYFRGFSDYHDLYIFYKGSASITSTLNVKGRGSDICNSEYCMNGAGCSIALISPGTNKNRAKILVFNV